MSFEKLIGNEKIKQILKNAVESNNVLHSYMFVGEEGIGKNLFAKEFAKMILCSNQDVKPCNQCKSCVEFNSENHPDFMQIVPDDGKTIKIEQVRFMQEKTQEKPVTSNKKVYLISKAETMTREAANSLLKTLEEPPEYVVIILTTSNESKILTTIKSRCMKLHFEPIPEEKIIDYLKQNGIDANLTENMLKHCEGSIGKAIKINDLKDQYMQIEQLINLLEKQSITQIWKKAEVLYSSKDDIIDLLNYMEIVIYNIIKKEHKIKYTEGIHIIEQTKQRLLANANYDMSIDNLLLKLWEEVN